MCPDPSSPRRCTRAVGHSGQCVIPANSEHKDVSSEHKGSLCSELDALRGVLSATRAVLMLWHRGRMASCTDDVQDALCNLDDAVDDWRDAVNPEAPTQRHGDGTGEG